MNLSRLLKPISHLASDNTASVPDSFDPVINSIHYNSKDVEKGGLFVAIKGLVADGHDYIDDAVKNGASVIITEKPVRADNAVVYCVTNSRKALAIISATFHNNPSHGMNIIGITGTNGKTTITYLLESILKKSGIKTGVIGTINYRYDDKEFQNPMTTPESLDLQKILFEMKRAGVTHVVMEISSHAIDLDRIEGCSIDSAVFTNLTQDHLDYHQSMEDYWDCKKRLFTDFLPVCGKTKKITAIINTKNSYGKELVSILNYPVITTGTIDSDVKPMNVSLTIDGITASVSTPVGEFELNSSIIGEHNLENILNAVGAAIASGISLEAIKTGLENVSIPGRLEKIFNNRKISVFVDYAHTPDALKNVLSTIKPLTSGKVICVFGCGGDRDTSKRPQMGKIAEKHSDRLVVTSDNPRTENPNLIISHILNGIDGKSFTGRSDEFARQEESKLHYIEPDRQKAIRYSINSAKQGDSVLIAGKGHETYQITNTGTIDFDDRKEAKTALENYAN